jgi:4'-phosphopantetheinyl transferase
VPLDPPEPVIAVLRRWLDVGERRRSARFRTAELRDRFVVAHAALRSILGRCAGLAPSDVEIVCRACPTCGEPHGKPALVGPAADLGFSLSHSDDLALVAVARGREVGVDVERIDERADIDRLVSEVLPERHASEIRMLPAEHRAAAFFQRWTMLEARAKATGEGLSAVLSPHDEHDAAWTVAELDGGSRHAAALAIEGSLAGVERWEWTYASATAALRRSRSA